MGCATDDELHNDWQNQFSVIPRFCLLKISELERLKIAQTLSHKQPTPFNLCTSRLLLREFIATDFVSLHTLLSCPRVMEFSGTGPLNQQQTHERLRNFITSYTTHGFGKWAVVAADSGELIGYCGVELTVVENVPVRELGFRYRPEFWGKGYAREAGGAVLKHCFGTLGWPEVLAFVEPENMRSVQTLTKLGFRFQRAAQWQHLQVHLYRATPG
ncbi:MAG: GNAT family N-acetyltransferase [Verrucomicrobiota bacterium]